LLGDNNGVALGTMMLVPLFAALAQTAKTKREKWLHQFFLVGVFLRGITTYSRGGFLAATALGVLMALRSPKRVRALLGIAAVVLIVNWAMPQAFWDRMTTIGTATDEDSLDDSARSRMHFWRVAMDMAAAKPLFGVGFSTYPRSFDTYNTSKFYAEQERSVHSIWFGVLAEMGYPGFALFVTIWGVSVWSAMRVRRAAKRDPTRFDFRAYATALESSLVVFAVGGSFLPAQYTEMPWHFFSLCTALHLLATSEAKEAEAAEGETVARQPALAH
jgi:putative inorganic carbon (HCO3(-)) transporter